MNKLCYFINSGWYFKLHWLDRATSALDDGYIVHIVSNFSDEVLKKDLEKRGFICHEFKHNEHSINLFSFFFSMLLVFLFFYKNKFDLIHCITIKPCLIGGVYARLFNKPVILSFVGLGRVFTSRKKLLSLIRKFVIFIYNKIVENKNCFLLFEHEKDKKMLSDLIKCRDEQTIIIKGAGVDSDVFAYIAETDRAVPNVLFASRLLWSKGLQDLIKARKDLRKENIYFNLYVAGISLAGDPDAIPEPQIKKWQEQDDIIWLGKSDNVCQLIKDSNIVALPSVYAEGIPRILLEAASIGRACIAYDSGGCGDIIVDDYNGFLVSKDDFIQFKMKMKLLLLSYQQRSVMGINGRKLIESQFSSQIVIRKTLTLYRFVSEKTR